MRNIQFGDGEFYHIYNRGTDKRKIFMDRDDIEHFLLSMIEFNTLKPIGSLYELSFRKNKERSRSDSLINILCYCLNPNHFHIMLQQVKNKGIEKFMHRLGTGYTRYFNDKHKRSGSLFQGSYKALHVTSNRYLLYLSSYINLNFRVHQLSGLATKLTASSWDEYVKDVGSKGFCTTKIILHQFSNKKEYKIFSEESLENILEQKEIYRDMEKLFLE